MGTEITSSIWGEYFLEVGGLGFWKVGPLRMWIQRLPNEWRIWDTSSGDPLDSELSSTVPFTGNLEEAERGRLTRVALGSTSPSIRLSPAMADRPVVARPEMSVQIPPGEEVEIFLSTPMWVMLHSGPKDYLISEFPSYRMSDTWFGPDTATGELCYATATTARLRLDELPIRRHRAVTSLLLRNNAGSMFQLDRLKLPMPHLGLFQSREGWLYTQRLIYEREKVGDTALLKLEDRPHSAAGETRLLTPARKVLERNTFVRAVSSLFS